MENVNNDSATADVLAALQTSNLPELVGDDMLMDLSSNRYCETIYYLLLYYYCFDLVYLPIYNEFLLSFQIFCMNQKKSAKKGINFRKFEADLEAYFASSDA